MSQRLKFAAEILLIIAITAAIQKHAFKVPVVGAYLPGGQ